MTFQLSERTKAIVAKLDKPKVGSKADVLRELLKLKKLTKP